MAEKPKAKPKTKRDTPLTNRQSMFILEYLVDLNASRAAARCGYKFPNVTSAQLMANEKIQKAIQTEINARKERLRMSADDVLLFIMEAAGIKASDFARWDQTGRVEFKTPEELGDRTRFIKKIKSTRKTYSGFEESETELELVNKDKMIDLLFKHFGLGAPIKVDETVPFAQLVAGALEAIKSVSTDDEE